MKAIVLVITLFIGTSAALYIKEENSTTFHWALLVAGSSGWYNYRHQADVCHSYQILHSHGIPDERIVVMMYDDIANNEQNPSAGVIINHPNGPNVYTGVPKDYNGEDVTPENFLAILQGNKTAMEGIGSGKVIDSGPDSNVFVYFSDHGATDLIAFPSDELMEKQLKEALENMSQQKKFKKLVFYLEACESGSMFDSYKVADVFTTTAANPDESSYACYYDEQLATYLGDVYSVKWMENSDKTDLTKETLLKQFKIVRQETNTSHVQKYMDMSIDKDDLNKYQSGGGPKVNQSKYGIDLPYVQLDAVPSPEVPLAILHRRLMATQDPRQRRELLQEIDALIQAQQRMIHILEETVKTVLNEDVLDKMMTRQGTQVSNWDCYRTAVRHFSDRCFNFKKHDYALSLMYIFANLCEQQVQTESITSVLDQQCK